MWELIIGVCLPLLLIGVVAARDEKDNLRLRFRPGQSWRFAQVFEGRQQTCMSVEGQMPMTCAQDLRSVRKGSITVLGTSDGVPAAVRVSFEPDCVTTMAQMGPKQSVPYPFAGRAVTVRRQADGRITEEIEGGMTGVVDMAAQQELKAYLYTNEGRPDHPVAVGEHWEPGLQQARRTYQLSGPDQVTGVSELVSVTTINGQRVAEVSLSIRFFAGADFTEAIRGERTVMDALTGERGMAALGSVDDIVEQLNRVDLGRYIRIPLRNESPSSS